MTDSFSLRIFKNLKVSSTKEANVKLVFWLKGRGQITINLQRYELYRQDIAIIMVNNLYEIESDDDGMCCVIDIPAKQYSQFTTSIRHVTGKKLTTEESVTLVSLIKYLIESLSERHSNLLLAEKLIKYICVEISDNDYANESNMHLNQINEEVHDYLVAHHNEKINKNDLVTAMQLSHQTLNSMFKATSFPSFKQYLNHIRLEHCLVDIITTSQPIEEIAANHGFNHYSRFISLFKMMYGSTPKLIRNTYQPASYSDNLTYEIDIDDNVLKLLYPSYAYDQNIHYTTIHINQAPVSTWNGIKDIYIEGESDSLNIHHVFNAKQCLNAHHNKIHYIVNIDNLNIKQRTSQEWSQTWDLLQTLYDFHINPVMKIKHAKRDILTSIERMAIRQLLEGMFNLIPSLGQITFEFMVSDLTSSALQKLRRLIAQYTDDVILIYQFTEHHFDKQKYEEIEPLVDKIIIPFNLIDELLLNNKKVIIKEPDIKTNLSTHYSADELKKLALFTRYYQKTLGIIVKSYSHITYKPVATLNIVSIFHYLINVLHRLRGKVIYQDDNTIVTQFKHEVQCVSTLPTIVQQSKHNDYKRLKFEGSLQYNHAEVQVVAFNSSKYRNQNKHSQIINDIVSHQQDWNAQFYNEIIDDTIILLPMLSIAHIKYFI